MNRLILTFALTIATLPYSASSQPVRPQLESCVPNAAPELRQRCDDAVSQQLSASSQSMPLDDGWKLVRTRDPGGGVDNVSIMRTADTAKSDIGLAGLSLRCAPTGTEVQLIVLTPQPRASHPQISFTVGSNQVRFEASVAPSAQALVLPQSASVLAAGAWQSTDELAVDIAAQPAPIRGVVPIKGLARAMGTLRSNCPLR